MESADRHLKSGDERTACLAHDLLQISGLTDLVHIGWELLPPSPRLRRTTSNSISASFGNGRPATPRARLLRQRLNAIGNFRDDQMNGDSLEDRCPLWVKCSLQEAPFVVVRRANMFDGMIPVGVRGSLRNQRFAAYLVPESIREQITPEQLTGPRGWLIQAQSREVPAFNALAAIQEKLADLPLAYGPTGGVGFELASGIPTATSTSDVDLIIRASERLPMRLAQELITIFSASSCRIDAQIETPRGAVSLAEYASNQTPLLLRQNDGPVLVDDPWA
jgi:phosphoribosyl-dephospho-CoA transferase